MSLNYSYNSSTFIDPYWHKFRNGTYIYFNSTYEMNFYCNASWNADPDIAGPGVSVSQASTKERGKRTNSSLGMPR